MKKNSNVHLELDTTGEFLSINPFSSKPIKNSSIVNDAVELLTNNLCFLWSHKEQVLSNPKMAFAEVQVGHNLAYTGTSMLRGVRLGVVLEWLSQCPQAIRTNESGDESLMFFFAGSPLSGCNQCVFIDRYGIREAVSVSPFRPVWESFMNINEDYFFRDIPEEVFTLEEVIKILKE